MSAEERLEICKKCPIMKDDPTYGPTCDNSKWINPATDEWSRYPKFGWKRGCGCKLRWKTKNLTAHCIAGKW